MPESAEEMIVRNLMDAINRLHDDLDGVELWTVALNSFQQPPPAYQPRGDFLLPTANRASKPR